MERVLVIGAGTMGAGIAQVVARAGYPTYLKDRDLQIVEKGVQAIAKSLDLAIAKGKATEDRKREILDRITPTAECRGLEGVSLVIEAVAEDLAVKRAVYEEIDGAFPAATIFASNTSALSITELGAMTGRQDRFVGMHFFNPAPVMKLVEIIRGDRSSEATVAEASAFVKSIDKTGVLVNEAPGFIVNRLLLPLINEAAFLLAEGVSSAESIDEAMKLGAGHPMGPLALADMIGLDVVVAIMDTLYREFGDSKYRTCPLMKQMLRAGRLGRKSGKGFYEY